MSVSIWSLCHSFENPGCSTPFGDLSERRICLDVNDSGYIHLVTHGGAPISVQNDLLSERIRTINQMAERILNIEACIETHCNWIDGHPERNGFFSIAHEKSPRGIALAEQINIQLESHGRTNLGVCKVNGKQRWIGTPREYEGKRLGFIEDTKIPAVIVEIGHLSNPREASWLSNRQNRERVGHAIAQGLIKWRSTIDGVE